MTAIITAQPAYSAEVAKTLKRKPALLIDGKWTTPISDLLIDVIDPSTGRKISEIADASAASDHRYLAATSGSSNVRSYGLANRCYFAAMCIAAT
jgi:phenylacetaldehyde dehydrogenase